MPSGTAVFLDSSILIARITHRKEIKDAINSRLESYSFKCSGMIVRCEIIRRLMIDANYMYGLSRTCGTIQEVNRRVEALPAFQRNKKQTCLQILNTVDEFDDDKGRLDRLGYLTGFLLKSGLRSIEREVHFFDESDCAIGKGSIVRKGSRFKFGPDTCRKTGDRCGIIGFLHETRDSLERIDAHLEKIEGKDGEKFSAQLKEARRFIAAYRDNPKGVRERKPCRSVGDLLIALESRSIPDFYTLNGKESQHLSRALGQNLFVRPTNPNHVEVECLDSDSTWPEF